VIKKTETHRRRILNYNQFAHAMVRREKKTTAKERLSPAFLLREMVRRGI
jgi:hypothetical protein